MIEILIDYFQAILREVEVESFTVLVCENNPHRDRLTEHLEAAGHFVVIGQSRSYRKSDFWKRQRIDWVLISYDHFHTPELELIIKCFTRTRLGAGVLIPRKTKESSKFKQDLVVRLGSPKELGRENWLIWNKAACNEQPTNFY